VATHSAGEDVSVDIEFDDFADVVSARVHGAKIVRARPAPWDQHILLELDADGHVVGLEVYGPRVIKPAFWRGHPGRTELPLHLLTELDAWLAAFWAQTR
jgi:uncharacterized protein YuzE